MSALSLSITKTPNGEIIDGARFLFLIPVAIFCMYIVYLRLPLKTDVYTTADCSVIQVEDEYIVNYNGEDIIPNFVKKIQVEKIENEKCILEVKVLSNRIHSVEFPSYTLYVPRTVTVLQEYNVPASETEEN